MAVVLLLLLAGFAIYSHGGRASVTYQPTPLKGDEQGCPSDEIKAQVIENFHSLIEERVDKTVANILQTVNNNPPGLTQQLPAGSCQQISENRPDLPSGNYWIRSSDGTAVQVYCDMARQCCNETTGGWTRVAYLNMTDPNQQCPPPWSLITSPKRTCGRANNGSCDSVTFPTHTIPYFRVCGRIIGYQCGETTAFGYMGIRNINESYVNGVSLTHGKPRQHLWTFAAALNSDAPQCQCDSGGANHPVAGNDYFCEEAAGSISTCNRTTGEGFITFDPLWDGEGCGPTSTCCEFNNPPWFCKTLPQPTTDDIEVRICGDSSITVEDTPIELIEIYIR